MLKYIFWLLALLPLNLLAAEIDGLYRAEVVVSDQGQAERSRAIVQGFKQMLVKVTGSRNIKHNQSLAGAISGAGRYVQQYRYQLKTQQAGTPEETEITLIQLTFDKLAVDQLLRSHGLPVWGSQRPQVLAWVGVESSGSRQLLMPEFNPKLVALLKRQAEERGIPLMLPVMDLQDQSSVSVSDLWGAFDQPLRSASQRYSTDMVVLIRLKFSNSGYVSSQWTLLDSDDGAGWASKDDDLGQVVQKGVNQLADIIAARYAPAGGNQTEEINIQVSGINSFSDMITVQQLLARQETVEDHIVRAIWQDKAMLSLKLRGGMQAFTQAIEISGILRQIDPLLSDISQPFKMNSTAIEANQPVVEENPQQPPQDISLPENSNVLGTTTARVEQPLEVQLYYQLQ